MRGLLTNFFIDRRKGHYLTLTYLHDFLALNALFVTVKGLFLQIILIAFRVFSPLGTRESHESMRLICPLFLFPKFSYFTTRASVMR